jgi:hypothetical protein
MTLKSLDVGYARDIFAELGVALYLERSASPTGYETDCQRQADYRATGVFKMNAFLPFSIIAA